MQNRLGWLATAGFALSVLFGSSLVHAQAQEQNSPSACDRLAAHPLDPDRIVPGVATSDVDQPAAIAACEPALEDDPGNSRLTYQLGRVYFYNGRNADAVRAMRAAAEAGYRQAQFVLGALVTNNRAGAGDDVCEVERWWARSAKAGREAAQVAYVRHATKGLFDGCALHASNEDMDGFLSNVRDGARDYYLRLLLTDLTEDLAVYKNRQ